MLKPMLHHDNDKEGGAPHKCWNLGPHLPCYATGASPVLRAKQNKCYT